MKVPAPRCLCGQRLLVPWLLGLGGLLLAGAGALPYAGSWNDGSRLAAVESIADRHTQAIDDSIFCRPPAAAGRRGCPPYPPHETDLLEHGTRDKLAIGGHFYSDKPPVISWLMAGLYQTAKSLGLPRAADRPDLFCRVLTVATAGLAYALALACLYRLGVSVGLPAGTCLGWTASLALATVALTYTRHVNNHVLLLGVVAAVCLQVVHLAREATAGAVSRPRLVGLGTLAGLGYNLDLGAGPLLLAALLGLVLYRCRRLTPVLVFLLAALPWVAAGLTLNHEISGVWKPLNTVPEYFAWPGCPFTPANMTGYARHHPFKLLLYSLALLLGKRGFLSHNLPLFLVLPALVAWLRRSWAHRPELTFALGWSAATWLLYAVFSNNYGGVGCSVRWFVPFLAPCYFLLAVYLRECPEYRGDFFILSLWGGVLAAALWVQGPWAAHACLLLWPCVGAALLSWLVYRYRYRAAAAATVRAEVVTQRQVA